MFGRKSGKICPFLRKPCIEHDCVMYDHVQLVHPQTGIETAKWDCAIKLNLVATLSVGKEVVGVQAATESFRNEVTEGHKRNFVIEAGKLLDRLPHAS